MANLLGSLIGSALSSAVSAAVSAAGSQKKKTSSGSSRNTSSAPAGYTGSAGSVGVYDDRQEAIRRQMNANSQAWYETDSQAEKDRLHAENEALAAQLGGSVRYDGTTGYWSGTAGAPTPPELASGSFSPTDQSEYLREMAAAQLARQQAALEEAYRANLSDLDAEQASLSSGYRAARNAAAADSAAARRSWQETAAARGLNSGTAGQAELALANRLQSDLTGLRAAEQAAGDELARQRSNLGREYRSALLQAQADNDYQLFRQLYDEAVRLDEALQQQSQFNAGMAMEQYQAALDTYRADLDARNDSRQQSRADQLAAAKLAAEAGDYSLYGQYYGWDDDRVRQMEALWQAAHGGSASSGGGSSGSGGRTGSGSSGNSAGGNSGGTALPADQLEIAAARGELGVDEAKVQQLYNNILEMRDTPLNRSDPDFVRQAIEAYRQQEQLGLTRQEYARLLQMFGLTV